MCGHDHNKQLITTNIKGKPITIIVCGSGGKIYDDENDLSQLPNIKDLEFVSDNFHEHILHERLKDQMKYYRTFYNWDMRAKEWVSLFDQLLKIKGYA